MEFKVCTHCGRRNAYHIARCTWCNRRIWSFAERFMGHVMFYIAIIALVVTVINLTYLEVI